MILLDNIIFELQRAGGVSLLWSKILKSCSEEKDLNFSLIDSSNSKENLFYSKENLSVHVYNEILPLFLRRYLDVNISGVNVFHSSYFRIHSDPSVKNIVTVHDFVYEKFDSGYRKYIHSYQKSRSLRRADLIICVSENTKNDLLAYYPDLITKDIRVIYNGVSDDFTPLNKCYNSVVNLELPYILYVGGRYSHKNFIAALNMLKFKVCKSINLTLKVVGSAFNAKELKLMHDLGVSHLVEYVGNVNNESLNKLYNDAFAFIYPSFYEGFGIPPLEAMAAGCPVICSNVSSIPEIVGSAGLLFDPYDIDSSEIYFYSLLDKSFRDNHINKGLLRSSLFSWKNTGDKTIALYKELLDC